MEYHSTTLALNCGFSLKHLPELILCEFQNSHIRNCCGHERLLDLIVVLVITGEHGSLTVERYDFSVAVFMLQIVLGCAGYDVMNPPEQFTALPQAFPFFKETFFMGLSEKVAVKLTEIIGKKVTRGKRKKGLLFVGIGLFILTLSG